MTENYDVIDRMFAKIKIVKQKLALSVNKIVPAIVSDSIQVFVMRIIVVAIGLTGNVLVARYYGPATLGLLALINSILVVVCMPSLLGLNVSILRIIPETQKREGQGGVISVFHKMLIIVSATGVCVTIFAIILDQFVFEDLFNEIIEPYLGFVFVAAILRGLIILITQYARARKQIKKFLVLNVIPPMMIMFGYLIGVAHKASNESILKIYFISIYVSFFILVLFIMKDVIKFKRLRMPQSYHSFKSIIKMSLPMMVTIVVTALAEQFSIIYLSSSVSISEVGIYSAAMKLSMLIGFSLKAVNTVIATRIAELHMQRHYDDMTQLSRMMSRFTFWCTLPFIILLYVYGREILTLIFGPPYTDAYGVLVVLLTAQFVNTASGCTGIFLNMTGHQREFRNIMMLNAVIYIFLCIVLIPRFGIIGAACAFCFAEFFWNFMSLVFIKKIYGSSIHYLPFFVKN